MELIRNYYSIYSTIHNDIKELIKSGNYEKIILDLMNSSKMIFPGNYKHLKNQAHGECDFVDIVTKEKYDVKISIDKAQGKKIGSRNGNVGVLSTEFHNEALEYGLCFSKENKKAVNDLKLYNKMKRNIDKTKSDENIIFFIPYPIVPDFENFPLVGTSDLLKRIYCELEKNIDISSKKLYVVYISFDHKMVLRDLKDDKREYLSYPDMQRYTDYCVRYIKTM